jgi:dCMP deaminase
MDRMLGFEPSGVGSIPAGPATKFKMKQKYIDLYMDWAARTAQLSHARRRQVGAVIVKDDSVISYGYNGMPSGWDNDCENIVGYVKGEPVYKTKPEVLHAERNALDKLAKRGGNGGKDAAMFITTAPCLECAKSIYGAGITEVFYGEDYRSEDGIYFLQKCGVNIVKMSKGDK